MSTMARDLDQAEMFADLMLGFMRTDPTREALAVYFTARYAAHYARRVLSARDAIEVSREGRSII